MIVQELAAKLGLEVDEQAYSRATHIMRGLATGLVGVGVAVSGAVVGLGWIAKGTADAATGMDDLANKLGVPAQALEELRFAAKMSSTDFDTLAAGIRGLSRRAGEAANGSTELAAAFAKIGVAVRGTDGQIRGAEDLLADVADRFHEMGPGGGVEKTALAFRLFGTRGAELVPFLSKGSAAIDELRARARELGIVFSDTARRDAVAYNDALTQARFAIEGVRNSIGAPFLTAFTRLLDMITRGAIAFRKFVEPAIEKAIRKTGAAIDWLRERFYLLQLLLGAVATFMLVKMLSTLGALTAAEIAWGSAALIAGARAAAASAIAGAAGAAALLPWLLLSAAIFLLFEDLYTFVTGGESAIGGFIAFLDKQDPNDTKFFAALRSLGSLIFDLSDPAKWERAFATMKEAYAEFFTWLSGEIKNRGLSLLLGDTLADGVQEALRGIRAHRSRSDALAEMNKTLALIDEKQRAASGGGAVPSVGGALQNTAGFLAQPFAGGAASPSASARISGASNVSDNRTDARTLHAPITIQVPPGSDAKTIGDAARDGVSEAWENELSDAYAATR